MPPIRRTAGRAAQGALRVLARRNSSLLRRLRLPAGPAGEGLLALLCLLGGALVIPCLIWIVGRIVLGPYAHGGVLALLGDFYAGLGRGSPPYWTVALGPYVLLQLLRFGHRLLR